MENWGVFYLEKFSNNVGIKRQRNKVILKHSGVSLFEPSISWTKTTINRFLILSRNKTQDAFVLVQLCNHPTLVDCLHE